VPASLLLDLIPDEVEQVSNSIFFDNKKFEFVDDDESVVVAPTAAAAATAFENQGFVRIRQRCLGDGAKN